MAHDLTTPGGLAAALEEAGGVIAELSRRSGVPARTLGDRAKRFGIRPGTTGALVELPRPTGELEKPALRPLGERPETKALQAAITADRRRKLDAALAGEPSDLSVTEFNFAVELDTVLEQHDHGRLLRAATLAIQAYPKRNTSASQGEYIRKVAAASRVNPKALDHYIEVLHAEIKYREATGQSRPDNLPKLTEPDKTLSAPTDSLEEE